MESLIKRDLVTIARFIAFVCFLVTFIPRFEDSPTEWDYASSMSFICFFVLLFIEITRYWKVLDDETNKRYIISSIPFFVLFLVFLVVNIISIVSLNAKGGIENWNEDMYWIGYLYIQVSWALIGGIYLLIGLTKTKDESKM